MGLESERITRRRALTAGAILLAVAAAVAVTALDPGLTWDEPFYYRFAGGYLDWFRHPHFDAPALHRAWGAGQVHPPLGKLWIAACRAVLGEGLGAVRVGAGIIFGLVASAVFLWEARRKGEGVAVVAAAAFVLMPRVFAHGHFATLEMPMVLLWLLTTMAFEKGIESRWWRVACGVLFGLALLTKINAVFLPCVLAPWALLCHRKKAWPSLLAMAVIGPLVFFAGWPALWHHPVAWVQHYLADKVGRRFIPVYYLGVAYRQPRAPWHYPFVMIAATTPVPILAAAVCGAARVVRRIRTEWRHRHHELLLLWSVVFQVLVMAMPGVPKYDGVRLLLPAMPFLAILAAYGAAAGWAWLRSRVRGGRRRAWGIGLGVAAGAWLALPVVWFHPFQLCHYNALVGGPWGANRMGFETTYWDDTLTGEVLQWVVATARAGDRVAPVAVGSLVWRSVYASDVFLTRGIRDGSFADDLWEILVVVPRQGYWTEGERAFIRSHAPAQVWYLTRLRRLPVCLAYRRPRGEGKPPPE